MKKWIIKMLANWIAKEYRLDHYLPHPKQRMKEIKEAVGSHRLKSDGASLCREIIYDLRSIEAPTEYIIFWHQVYGEIKKHK